MVQAAQLVGAQVGWETAAVDAQRRILHVCSTRHRGGLERESVRIASRLMREFECYRSAMACKAASFTQQLCDESDVAAYPLSIRNSGDIWGAHRLKDIIRDFDANIVHVHSRRDFLPTALALEMIPARSRPALIFHCHMVRALGEPRYLSGWFFGRSVSRFVAVSESVAAAILRNHTCLKPDQVVTVHNGLDCVRFSPDDNDRQSIRSALGIASETVVVGMVGRLGAKGQDAILKAAIEASDAIPKNIHFLFVGDESKKGERDKLVSRFKTGPLQGRVSLVGGQENVCPYLNAMDIFAHLPVDEAFGIALAEAMSVGLPVISSRVPGCIEVLGDGRGGILADPWRTQSVASALIRLTNSSRDRKQMGQAGRERIVRYFSVEHQAARLHLLYDQILTQRSR